MTRRLETRPLLPPAMNFTGISVCHFGFKTPQKISTYNGRHTLHREMANRSRVLRPRCKFLHVLAETHGQRPSSTLFSPLQASHSSKRIRFFSETSDYFGHAIRTRRLEIVSHTADAKSRFKEPTNIPEPCWFLG